MKFCKDCKYSSTYRGNLLCIRPVGVDLTDGSNEILNRWCHAERELSWLPAVISGNCGKSGRYFKGEH